MAAVAGVEGRLAHQAMHPGLGAQPAVGVFALHFAARARARAPAPGPGSTRRRDPPARVPLLPASLSCDRTQRNPRSEVVRSPRSLSWRLSWLTSISRNPEAAAVRAC